MTEVTLRFRNQQEKQKFLEELSDGYGENHCQLDWGVENGVRLKDAKVINIVPFGPLIEDDDYDDFGLQKMEKDLK